VYYQGQMSKKNRILAPNDKKNKTRTNPLHTKNLILQQAEELFFKFGFSKVTVDEIARELGMSKKTIYLHFADKKALVKNIIRKNQQQLLRQIDECLDNHELAFIQKLQSTMKILTTFFAKISPYFVRNVKQHYPELWQQINDFKQKQSFKRIQLLMQEGIKEGIIRNDIPPSLLIPLYFFMMENIITGEKITALPCSPAELFEAVVKLIFGGILKDPARQLFFEGGSDE
jgi:AcrR family transcriptional regulator